MVTVEEEIANKSQQEEWIEANQIKEKTQQREEAVTNEDRYNVFQLLLEKSSHFVGLMLKQMNENKEQQQREALLKKPKEKKVKSATCTRKSARQASKSNQKEVLRDGNKNCVKKNSKSNDSLCESDKKPKKRNSTPEGQENRMKRKQHDDLTEESITKRAKIEDTENDEIDSNDDINDSLGRTINGEEVSDRQPRLFTGGVMRPYQLDGFDWLKQLYENGLNGILGDEMGLGKTIQSIALIAHFIDMGVSGPFLICGPLSTLTNWMMEFSRFTPQVKVILYHGNQTERAELRSEMRKASVFNGRKILPVVITSYEIAMRDQPLLNHFQWSYLIIDEGHRIKNFNCRLVRDLKKLQSDNRLLLTGTPLQNNLSELWSLLNFLLPIVFDDLDCFQTWFNAEMLSDDSCDQKIIEQEQEKQIVTKLHQILTPFLLRRVKTDVALSIPPKKEMLVYAPMTHKQDVFYKATADGTIESLICPQKEEEEIEYDKKGRPKRRCSKKVDYSKMLTFDDTIDYEDEDDEMGSFKAMINASKPSADQSSTEEVSQALKLSVVSLSMRNKMMVLRKICNHPYLIDYPLDPSTQQYLVSEELINCSGKMRVLDMMLIRLKSLGHKVLIFSQMTKILDILQDYCYMKKYSHCRLDGSMNMKDRQEQITSFNEDPDVFIFLLSTRAGGLGINLTAADTVIIFDSDWNPQADLQAQDRCHRIGQNLPVVVYKLVTSGTVDEKIVERAANKRKLEKMIIHKGKFKSGRASIESSLSALSTNDLMEILKSKDYQKSVHANDEIFSESQLEMLLDRSDLMNSTENKDKVQPKPRDVENVFKVISGDSK